MPTNHRHYFDLVSDLRRIVYCIVCDNMEGAQTFQLHAHKIYKTSIKSHELKEIILKDLDTIWNLVMDNPVPKDSTERKKYADRTLTLSSILFHRTYSLAFPKTLVKS